MFLAKLKGEGLLNHLLHVGVMLTIISVHHPIPTHANRKILKINQQALLSVECPGIFSSWQN